MFLTGYIGYVSLGDDGVAASRAVQNAGQIQHDQSTTHTQRQPCMINETAQRQRKYKQNKREHSTGLAGDEEGATAVPV